MIDNPPPWPEGKRAAVAFSFDVDADSVVHAGAKGSLDDQLHALAYMRYDPFVAIPRLTRLFESYAVPVSYFVPGWVAEQYPSAIEAIARGDNEIAHHGYLHEWPTQLSPQRQRDVLEKGSEIIERVSGQRPRGYRAPYYGLTTCTVELLIEMGFLYESSLFADDVPILLSNRHGSLVEVPVPDSVDDYNQYVSTRAFDYLMGISAPERAMEVFRAEFDALYEFGGLWVGVWHPAVSGRPSRVVAMRGLIEHMLEKGDVWFATHEQIASHVLELLRTGRWQPRTEKIPLHQDRGS